MPRAVTTANCALWLAVLLLCSCSGSGSVGDVHSAPAAGDAAEVSLPAAAEESVSLPSLPAPAALLGERQKGLSYTAADLRVEAESFGQPLPHNRVAATVSGAVFSPAWSPGDPLENLAYATYAFAIEGYDLNSQLKFSWTTLPAQGSLWVALSDWEKNRWAWFRPAADSLTLNLASIDPYISLDGDMLVAVMFTGDAPCELDWLRAGSELPVAVLEVSGPRSAWGELETSFDASASTDPDGEIVRYDWDWNGDGSFDNTTGSSPLAEHTFTEQGTHLVQVRVKDNAGITAVAGATVSVGGNWSHTYGTGGYDHFTGVAAAPDGSIWAAGYIYDPFGEGPANEALLVRFGADGELLDEIFWAASNGDLSTQYYLDIAVDVSDGSVYVVGDQADGGPMNKIVQRWTPEGELDYFKVLPSFMNTDTFIRVAGPHVLVGGTNLQPPAVSQGSVYMLDKQGLLQGLYTSGPSVKVRDAAYRSSVLALDPPRLMICGEYNVHDLLNPEIFETDAMFCSIPLDGSAVSGMLYGSFNKNESASAIVLYNKTVSNQAPLLLLSAFDPINGLRCISLAEPGAQAFSGHRFSSEISPLRAHGFGGGFYASGTTDAPMLLSFLTNGALSADYRFEGMSVGLNDSATGPSASAVFCGTTLAANAGGFVDGGASLEFAMSNLWVPMDGLFIEVTGETTDMPTDNFSERQPGDAVLDTGGGEQDAWIHVYKP